MTSQKKPRTAPDRTVYKKPILVTYGKLKDLTTGGSGKSKEGSGGKKPRP
jgi:hypothetical protein